MSRARYRRLGWLALVVGYALAVAAAWTGKNTDTAESLGLTAFFTILLAIVFALAATP